MRKNSSKIISFNQYRLTDLFLFGGILVVFELISFFARTWFVQGAMFTVYVFIPVALIVTMRWGWQVIFFGVIDALAATVLNGYPIQNFVIYLVGNAFVLAAWGFALALGKQRVASKWYFSTLYILIGWLAVCLGRSVMAAIFGNPFVDELLSCLGLGDPGLLGLAFSIIIILIIRRFEGMFMDQKQYLLHLEEERKRASAVDSFGGEWHEIDPELLKSLNKRDEDLFG